MANTKQKEILKKIRALPLRKYGSAKPQAPSLNQNLVQVLERQATSIKLQATSPKLNQTRSFKLRDP